MKNRFFIAIGGFFIATIFWFCLSWENFSNGNSVKTVAGAFLTVLSIISMISVYVRYKKTK